MKLLKNVYIAYLIVGGILCGIMVNDYLTLKKHEEQQLRLMWEMVEGSKY